MRVDESVIVGMLDERPDEGVFRVHRRMFIDPAIFDLEMQHIFEAGWVYLAHESQIPAPFDFLTTHIGRQPVIVNRTASGNISAMLNSCAHRGTLLEPMQCGSRKTFICPFHAWTYDAAGKLLGCGDTDKAGYGPGFDKATLGLKAVAKVESYRGFIFGSLSANVPSLADHLGEARKFLDLIVDQDPDGEIEIVPGPQAYTFDGNWKLQSENGVDGYHIQTIHANYVLTSKNRFRLDGESARVKPMDVSRFAAFPGGYYALENGHVVLWNESPNPESRPSAPNRDDFTARFGADRGWWMGNCWRNLFLYPNVFIMDQMSTQIRVIRPLSVDKTEVRTFCFAPKSDTAEQRTHRIRQYEDFFNASGMATPDDLAAFNASQKGFGATGLEWSDVSRGSMNIIEGGDSYAERMGLRPEYCGRQLEDEGIYLNQHRRWRDLLVNGMRGVAAAEGGAHEE
jgi:benzoate/toluate 1,2-dioxygenase subunit alpha